MGCDVSQFSSWIEIDTQAIKSNLTTLSKAATSKNMQSLLMVKANAYGHGMQRIAEIASASHIDMLGVSFLTEALTLKIAGNTLPILIMNPVPVEHLDDIADTSTAITIHSLIYLRRVNEWAKEYQQSVLIHLKINTGLNRFGFTFEDLESVIQILDTNSHLVISGIYTHYSMADSDDALTRSQYEQFLKAVQTFRNADIQISLIHASNSAALSWAKNDTTNLVRLGLVAYGLQPSSTKVYPYAIAPALTWKATIMAIRSINEGESAGYGKAWIASRQSVIVVIGVGYSDGLRRNSEGRDVLINGQKAPIIGNIMMNHTIIDVTAVQGSINEGDVALLVGSQNGATLSLEEIASTQHTINEEVVTMISPTISRIYID
jgi:alanine racemase